MQSYPLIINCSTDRAFCWCWEEEHIVPYKDLERTLPKKLWEIVSANEVSSIVLINGPWWFTALRIGALCAWLIATEYDLPLYSRTKIDLYKYCYEQWVLPQQWYITIGQRKNVWLYDFDAMESTIVRVVDEFILPDTYFVDMLDEHVLLEKTSSANMLMLKWWTSWLEIIFAWKEAVLNRELLTDATKKVEKISPDYMIEPTLG